MPRGQEELDWQICAESSACTTRAGIHHRRLESVPSRRCSYVPADCRHNHIVLQQRLHWCSVLHDLERRTLCLRQCLGWWLSPFCTTRKRGMRYHKDNNVRMEQMTRSRPAMTLNQQSLKRCTSRQWTMSLCCGKKQRSSGTGMRGRGQDI